MKQSSRISKGKQINPTFFVFCEGETEAQYLLYLKSKYKFPIDVKINESSISDRFIANYKKNKPQHEKDKNYLMYDLDVENVLPKLLLIKDAHLLSSNPCFECWYLLHYQEQNAYLTSDECKHKLHQHHTSYKKGSLDNKLKAKLEEKQEKAIHRAAKLNKHENPS
ncbi:MAG: RloB domain-containing protein, partial [Bacteroidales bacterium]